MSNKRILKAYERYDYNGRVVSGSLLLRDRIPKNGKWRELTGYECCNDITTTSTTTTPSPSLFISTWRTSSPDESISLPYSIFGTYDGVIDWGDSTTSPNTYEDRTHTYAIPGDYTVTINGTIVEFSFNNGSTAEKIISISQWGNLQLGTSTFNFAGCINLDLSAVIDVLNLTGKTNLTNMFASCTSLTTINRINEWDVSGVIIMENVFLNCNQFNQDLNGWDTSSVTDMNNVFSGAFSFNGNIGAWNTINVTTMHNMFYYAAAFNQNIGLWNTGNLTTTLTMFEGASSFNNGGSPSINNWNTSSVTTMDNMFVAASSFNQPIGNWNTSAVTSMSIMFANTSAFNQNISSWNVSSVSSMLAMFFNATSFNQDLSGWCVTLIPSTPPNFDTGAAVWILPQPVWGTCPV